MRIPNKLQMAIAVMFLITAIACKRHQPFDFLEEQGLYDAGKTRAMLNGKPWESTFTFLSYFPEGTKRLTISLNVYKGEALVQGFDINCINLQQKVNTIYSFQRLAKLSDNDPHRYDTTNALFVLSEDVGVLATYEVLESATEPNQILIDSVDANSHTVTGSFQVTFFKRDGLTPTPYGFADTLKFTNGAFVLKLP